MTRPVRIRVEPLESRLTPTTRVDPRTVTWQDIALGTQGDFTLIEK